MNFIFFRSICLVRRLSYISLTILISVFFTNCDKDELREFDGTGSSEVENPPLTTSLPHIKIYTDEAIVDDPKVLGSIEVIEGNTVSFSGNIGIEIRGASSQMFPKKSYGLETRDADNMDLDVSILGFPEEEDWILHAPYSDKSLMRNMLMYDLSRALDRYTSRSKFVELTVNDAFKGVYVFMEKLKRDKNRIDISKLNENENSGEDITGGYILKIDKTAGNNLGNGINPSNSFPSRITSEGIINFQYEYPKAEVITSEQKSYIADYIHDFEGALISENFKDPAQGYASFIDVASFIDFFLMNELSNNVDGYRISTYMHKDKSEKLKMGPVWDFNLGFGNADYCSGGNTDVWAYEFNSRCPGGQWQVPFWWGRLLEDPAYVSQLKARWQELRGGHFSNASVNERINTYLNLLEDADAVRKNFIVWPVLGNYIWPNNFVGNSYDEEFEYLQNWIENRLVWLDGAIGAL